MSYRGRNTVTRSSTHATVNSTNFIASDSDIETEIKNTLVFVGVVAMHAMLVECAAGDKHYLDDGGDA